MLFLVKMAEMEATDNILITETPDQYKDSYFTYEDPFERSVKYMEKHNILYIFQVCAIISYTFYLECPGRWKLRGVVCGAH